MLVYDHIDIAGISARAGIGELSESEDGVLCVVDGDGVMEDSGEVGGQLPLLLVWRGLGEEGVWWGSANQIV